MALYLVKLIRRNEGKVGFVFVLSICTLYGLCPLSTLFETNTSQQKSPKYVKVLSSRHMANEESENSNELSAPVLTGRGVNSLKPPSEFAYTIDQKDLCRKFSRQEDLQSTREEWREGKKLSEKDGKTGLPLALIVVLSRMKNFKQRQVIRSSWGDQALLRAVNMPLVFMVGRAKTATSQAFLRAESDRYWDIVQVSILESYRNLTMKSLAALKWAYKFCNDAPWVFKTDDDAVVNIFALRNYFHDLASAENTVFSLRSKTPHLLYPSNAKNSVLCERVNKGVTTLVLRTGPKAVSYNEYKETHFPEYCMGLGYALPTSSIPAILFQTRQWDGSNLLGIEDVFITGIIANRYLHLNLQDIHNISYRSHQRASRSSIVEKFVQGERFVLEMGAELNHLTSSNIWKMWYRLKEQNIK